MKKVHYFSAFAALLICAALIYSCKKDTPFTPTAPVAPVVDEQVATDRTSSCQEVMIANGVGLEFCGADGAQGAFCLLCPSGDALLTPITAHPQTFWVTSSTHFTLYNNTGSFIRPTIILNCAWQFSQMFNIPAWDAVHFNIKQVGGGCCLVEVCTG